MSENAKLRALLAEARGWVGGWSGILPVSAAVIDSLRQRIDVALAEPVARLNPYSAAVAEMRGDAWQKQAMQRERERDEARAEVRRTYKELSESIAREAEAYERGAKAMREAAALGLDRLLTKKKATAIWVAPDEIRALPLPEDKP